MTEKDLLKVKEEIEESKSRVSELKGQQKALLKQLKDEFDCDTIEEAEEKLAEYENAITTLDKKIKRGLAEVDKKFNLVEKEE